MMTKQLEPKYTLFDSLEEMLAPETLSDLLSKPITHVDIQTITDHGGVAGGKLSYLITNNGRLVLKQMSVKDDWIMFSSDDQHCRSVTLWQYGLLDQLHPKLEHKTLACGYENSTWVILMEDLTKHVFRGSRKITPEITPIFLDALARIHATFWNDSRLRDPRLGLCNETQLLNMTIPPVAQKYPHISMGWIPEAVRGGAEILEDFLDADVYAHVQHLFENPQPLINALRRYPFTLLHGDYREANLAHQDPQQVMAFDWQEATCSLMTIDLAWFTGGDYVRDGLGGAQAIRYYRRRLEDYLNKQFDDREWQAMIELGILFHILRVTCFDTYLYKHADNPKQKHTFETKLNEYNQQVRDGISWL